MPDLVSAAVTLGLASVLLVVGAAHRANRVLALLLTLRGLLVATYSLGFVQGTETATKIWWHLFPFFLIPVPFVILYFVIIYPRPRRLGPSRLSWGWILLLLALASIVAYAIGPTLFWDLDAYVAHPEGPEANAPAGPLFIFDVLLILGYAVAALVFGWDYVRPRQGDRSLSSLLISFGFVASVLHGGISLALFVPEILSRHPWPLRGAMMATWGLSMALVVLLVVLFVANARHPEASVRAALRRYMILVPLPALTPFVALWMPSDADLATRALLDFFSALWRMSLPVVVTYALVRHHLFDLDLKTKWAFKQSTVAIFFIVVFFVVSEAAVAIVGEGTGSTYIGIAVAALLLFALAPVQRLAERMVDAALPQVSPTPEYLTFRKFEVYKETLQSLLADGVLTEKERTTLKQLRQRVGITDADAEHMEQEVRRALGLSASEAPSDLAALGPG